MTYAFYIVLGALPGVVWLFFYLKQDSHPESNKMILKVFFSGMAISVLVIGFQRLWTNLETLKPGILNSLFLFLIGPAFIEEYFKYFVVRVQVINNREFDEPVDAMVYLIIAALGFATIENILFVIAPVLPIAILAGTPLSTLETIEMAGLRFAGATLLHALASGIVGYFLALTYFATKKINKNPLSHPAKKRRLVLWGITIATVLHTAFNYFIIKLTEPNYNVYLIILLAGAAFAVSLGFAKLRKLSLEPQKR